MPYYIAAFEQIDDGLWNLIPVNAGGPVLRRNSALMVSAPRDLFIRSGDAVHLTTAREIGGVGRRKRLPHFGTRSNGRHVLAAAYFGLTVYGSLALRLRKTRHKPSRSERHETCSGFCVWHSECVYGVIRW
jgi:hypothetical protein